MGGIRGLVHVANNLPPRDLWPERVYDLPELQYPSTLNLAEHLLRHADTGPDRAAVMFRGRTISYDSLRRRVLALASGLIRTGIRPTDRVALQLPNCPDFIVAWLALQWIGAISVQIPPSYRRREIEYILDDADCAAVIRGAGLLADVPVAGRRSAAPITILAVPDEADAPLGAGSTWIDEIMDERADTPAPHSANRDDPASLTYIASVDGRLKGVVHSPIDLLAAADTYARNVLQLTSADVCIGSMSLAWAFGLGSLLTFPLRVGAATALTDSGAGGLLEAITSSRATVLFGVPTMYRMLLRRPDLESLDLRSLRRCVSAAEPLLREVLEAWRARTGLDILDGLGTTELTHIFISARPGDVRPGLIGTTVPGYHAQIVDEAMHEVPRGMAGRLAVRGPTGARYWRNPDAQRRTVRDGWTLTGDICIQHADGWFEHVSRSDNLIVSAGSKISRREVECVLEAHVEVSRAHVFSVPDPVRGNSACAIVVPARGADTEGLSERLQRYLKGELAAFKCPRHIQVVGALNRCGSQVSGHQSSVVSSFQPTRTEN